MKDELLRIIRELNFEKLTPSEKIAKTRRMVELLTDNPDFPNPDPPLEEITTTIDEYERAYRKLQFAKYEEQVARREIEEMEMALVEKLKNQPRN